MTAPRYHSTVAQILERSAARFRGRTALIFEGREWSYAELDRAVSRVAHQLLHALGLEKGDRVAAYGKNSDAYVILYLACARSGLVHVPVNFNAVAGELDYLLEQSGSRVVFADASLRDRVRRDAHDLRETVVGWATADGGEHREEGVGDDDLVQLLYTSGTTSAPKGAMMTHRAFVHEYLSCLQALDMREEDVPLHALPLYHSAQMHVFMLPYLSIGATNRLVEAPDPADILERIERDGLTSVFAPPTVWVAIANHPELRTRDLGTLRKAYYGASIMSVPVLQALREALPQFGFYICFCQSVFGPLSMVLSP